MPSKKYFLIRGGTIYIIQAIFQDNPILLLNYDSRTNQKHFCPLRPWKYCPDPWNVWLFVLNSSDPLLLIHVDVFIA